MATLNVLITYPKLPAQAAGAAKSDDGMSGQDQAALDDGVRFRSAGFGVPFTRADIVDDFSRECACQLVDTSVPG